ncbi:hypothetical protein Vadar_027849 [Vaccinium darrowii]|uniref:Uncharacterized protein n=1 Tax=Vaccinium darrowii TaxID=229202 RepID=A0ACB7YZS9_9ERIC|nr:hypothetical protein Vadar_027849 [Vaccinium darrowii]
MNLTYVGFFGCFQPNVVVLPFGHPLVIVQLSRRELEEPEDATKGRDLFNEKPPPDELLSASDIGKSLRQLFRRMCLDWKISRCTKCMAAIGLCVLSHDPAAAIHWVHGYTIFRVKRISGGGALIEEDEAGSVVWWRVIYWICLEALKH